MAKIGGGALIKAFIGSFQIYSMAIGGLFAYIAFIKWQGQKYLLNKYLFVGVLLFTTLAITLVLSLGKGLYSLLFALIIYNLACNKDLKSILEIKPFHYLGKISYGLYMYHSVAIVLSIKILDYLECVENIILLIILATGLSVLLSHISYYYMESYFIRRKTKYSKIISGENAIE
ncbi:hypothetical protein PG637_06415 [Riemerella anatipestifer]|nr:hypothetical protein [Riemerella anatipestifer]MDY3325306.1 hypothetical protein [Riemerella anatipestifer]MDY3352704.1 hypothetical protein [Riemerella anatipestifer]